MLFVPTLHEWMSNCAKQCGPWESEGPPAGRLRIKRHEVAGLIARLVGAETSASDLCVLSVVCGNRGVLLEPHGSTDWGLEKI